MPALNNTVHMQLERKIMPKMRVGIQIAVIAAALLIFFTPHAGLLKNVVPDRINWLLSVIGILMLFCAAIVVVYLPAYYRRLSRLMREETPTLMRVTVREDTTPGEVLAELRRHEADENAPVEMVVRVVEKVNVPPHFPAEVYAKQPDGPVVIQTVHGILWPIPDERQQKLEQLFRVRS